MIVLIHSALSNVPSLLHLSLFLFVLESFISSLRTYGCGCVFDSSDGHLLLTDAFLSSLKRGIHTHSLSPILSTFSFIETNTSTQREMDCKFVYLLSVMLMSKPRRGITHNHPLSLWHKPNVISRRNTNKLPIIKSRPVDNFINTLW